MGGCWRVAQPRRLSASGLLRIGRLLFGLKDLGLVDCGLPSFRSQPKAESSDLGRKAAAAEHAVRVGRRWHQPADATATTLHRRVAPVAAVLRDRLEVMALLFDEHLRLRELLLLLLRDVLNLTLDQELALALRLLLLLEVRLLLCDLRLLLREQLRLMFGELSQQRQSRLTRPLDQKERGSELTRDPCERVATTSQCGITRERSVRAEHYVGHRPHRERSSDIGPRASLVAVLCSAAQSTNPIPAFAGAAALASALAAAA